MSTENSDPDHVTIRVARVADAHDVTELLRASYGAALPGQYDDATLAAALPTIAVASAALLMSGSFWVAVDDGGRIVGTGGWTPRPPAGEDTAAHVGHLRQFAIAPGLTGQGIGGAIARRCIDSIRAAGLTCVEAHVPGEAVGFFEQQGLTQMGHTTLPFGRAELPVIRMCRDL